MKVETYEVEEMKSSEATTMAADAEALELIEKMGLAGQRKLANHETGTRMPYRRLSALENVVFGLHCPINTKLEDYASGIIPVRVLQVAAHCKDQNFFPRIEIWHPEDARLDPVLLGRTKQEYYLGELFLLARWGEVWKDFAQLVTEAKAIWLATQRGKLAKIRKELDGDTACLESIADEMFATGKSKSVSYSGF